MGASKAPCAFRHPGQGCEATIGAQVFGSSSHSQQQRRKSGYAGPLAAFTSWPHPALPTRPLHIRHSHCNPQVYPIRVTTPNLSNPPLSSSALLSSLHFFLYVASLYPARQGRGKVVSSSFCNSNIASSPCSCFNSTAHRHSLAFHLVGEECQSDRPPSSSSSSLSPGAFFVVSVYELHRFQNLLGLLQNRRFRVQIYGFGGFQAPGQVNFAGAKEFGAILGAG